MSGLLAIRIVIIWMAHNPDNNDLDLLQFFTCPIKRMKGKSAMCGFA